MSARPPTAPFGRRARTVLGGLRLRLLWWFVLVLAVATVGSALVARQILQQRLDARIDADLIQEISEVQRLAGGNDPETGEPFGDDVARIFEVALDRNVPARSEVILTFVDGQLAGQSGGERAPTLDELPIDDWAAVREPTVGRLERPDGTSIVFRAIPFRVDGATRGTYVVAIDRDQEAGDTDAASLAAAAVGLAMLLIGSLLAIRLADRIIRPVREVRLTAQAISETDLSRRIPVEGHDEISELAATFNDMLERLETAFDTQRRFLDDAGHELRTPITVIQGHLDTLGEDPTERARTLELLQDELARVRRLVDDLITLARADRPDFVRPGPVDLGDLTRRVLEKARGLGERAWVLDAVVDEPIRADEQRLTQALLQLAENAVRHTTTGAAIGIGSAMDGPGPDESAAGQVRLWVRDTGPGVALEEQERIFERFFRGRDGRRRAEGSGLGLSIVSAIAEAHGGRASLSSSPGQGATFTIGIPLRRGDEA
jgi:two-component system OmpR family sensor kinase